MGFARTVLGDVDGSEFGCTYAHEHLIIAGGRPVELYPDILLDSVDKAVEEVAPAQALGLRTVVDAMPADCGRDVGMLAVVSRRSGLNIVAATGLHTQRYYHDRHWSSRLDAERMAALFVGEIESGIDPPGLSLDPPSNDPNTGQASSRSEAGTTSPTIGTVRSSKPLRSRRSPPVLPSSPTANKASARLSR